MNANELADLLEVDSWYKLVIREEIATMLRQQQAEIEALKTEMSPNSYDDVKNVANKLLKVRIFRDIDELKIWGNGNGMRFLRDPDNKTKYKVYFTDDDLDKLEAFVRQQQAEIDRLKALCISYIDDEWSGTSSYQAKIDEVNNERK